jgi:hypothetical protein
MRRLILLLLVSGCGSAPGGMWTSSDMAGGGGGTIPDPGAGNAIDNNLDVVEPNNTPATATPLGTSTGMGDLHVWVNGNNIGGGDTSDFWVFKSASKAGQFSFSICWMAPITGMNATLWQVTNGQQVMPPIHTWTGSGNCVQSGAGDAPMMASTTYLFGVTATGGSGMYSA